MFLRSAVLNNAVEVIFGTGAVFTLILVLVFLPGLVASKYIIPGDVQKNREIGLLAAPGFSFAGYYFALFSLVYLGLPNLWIAIVLVSIVALCGLFWCKQQIFQFYRLEQYYSFLFFFFALLLLLVGLALFPSLDIREASADRVMLLTGLPNDNVIPYNFSRMLIERIGPNWFDIVPGWRAGDRGPMAGIFAAVVQIVLGLEDHGAWHRSSPLCFFVFQVVGIALNLFSLFALWIVVKSRWGSRAATYALLLATVNYFFVINAVYTWPKFFMAYFVLTALAIYDYNRQAVFLSALFLACGMLSHDSGLFCAVTFFLVLFWAHKRFWKRGHRSVLLRFVFGFVLTALPWAIAKHTFAKSSPRLLNMHVFCDKRESAGAIPFSQALSEYLQKNSFQDIVATRLYNIIYPFDVRTIQPFLPLFSSNILLFFNSLAIVIFFQIVFSVGPFSLLLFLRSLMSRFDDRQFLGLCALVTFFAVVPLALISGCRENTVSHIWAYPCYLVICAGAGVALSRLALAPIIFGVALPLRIWILCTFFFLHSVELRPLLHSGPNYFSFAIFCLMALLISVYFLARESSEVS